MSTSVASARPASAATPTPPPDSQATVSATQPAGRRVRTTSMACSDGPGARTSASPAPGHATPVTGSAPTADLAATAADMDDLFARAQAMGLRLTREEYERTRAGVTAFLRAKRPGTGVDAVGGNGEPSGASASAAGKDGAAAAAARTTASPPAPSASAMPSTGFARHASGPLPSFFSAIIADEMAPSRPRPSLDALGHAEEKRRRREKRRRLRVRLERQLERGTLDGEDHGEFGTLSANLGAASAPTTPELAAGESSPGSSVGGSLRAKSARAASIGLGLDAVGASERAGPSPAAAARQSIALRPSQRHNIAERVDPDARAKKAAHAPSQEMRSPGLSRLSSRAWVSPGGTLGLARSPEAQRVLGTPSTTPSDSPDRTAGHDDSGVFIDPQDQQPQQLLKRFSGGATPTNAAPCASADVKQAFDSNGLAHSQQWGTRQRLVSGASSSSAVASAAARMQEGMRTVSFLDKVMANKRSPRRLRKEARARAEAQDGHGHAEREVADPDNVASEGFRDEALSGASLLQPSPDIRDRAELEADSAILARQDEHIAKSTETGEKFEESRLASANHSPEQRVSHGFEGPVARNLRGIANEFAISPLHRRMSTRDHYDMLLGASPLREHFEEMYGIEAANAIVGGTGGALGAASGGGASGTATPGGQTAGMLWDASLLAQLTDPRRGDDMRASLMAGSTPSNLGSVAGAGAGASARANAEALSIVRLAPAHPVHGSPLAARSGSLAPFSPGLLSLGLAFGDVSGLLGSAGRRTSGGASGEAGGAVHNLSSTKLSQQLPARRGLLFGPTSASAPDGTSNSLGGSPSAGAGPGRRDASLLGTPSRPASAALAGALDAALGASPPKLIRAAAFSAKATMQSPARGAGASTTSDAAAAAGFATDAPAPRSPANGDEREDVAGAHDGSPVRSRAAFGRPLGALAELEFARDIMLASTHAASYLVPQPCDDAAANGGARDVGRGGAGVATAAQGAAERVEGTGASAAAERTGVEAARFDTISPAALFGLLPADASGGRGRSDGMLPHLRSEASHEGAAQELLVPPGPPPPPPEPTKRVGQRAVPRIGGAGRATKEAEADADGRAGDAVKATKSRKPQRSRPGAASAGEGQGRAGGEGELAPQAWEEQRGGGPEEMMALEDASYAPGSSQETGHAKARRSSKKTKAKQRSHAADSGKTGSKVNPPLPYASLPKADSGYPGHMEWDKPDGSRIVKLVSEELQAALQAGTIDAEPPARYFKLPPGWGGSKEKPASVSYAGLIGQAILSSSDGRLSLNEVYNWISSVHPFFERGDRGWQNSIRHNLSLNKSFVKIERESSIPGKGGWWAIKPGHEDRFRNGVYLTAPGRESAAGGLAGTEGLDPAAAAAMPDEHGESCEATALGEDAGRTDRASRGRGSGRVTLKLMFERQQLRRDTIPSLEASRRKRHPSEALLVDGSASPSAQDGGTPVGGKERAERQRGGRAGAGADPSSAVSKSGAKKPKLGKQVERDVLAGGATRLPLSQIQAPIGVSSSRRSASTKKEKVQASRPLHEPRHDQDDGAHVIGGAMELDAQPQLGLTSSRSVPGEERAGMLQHGFSMMTPSRSGMTVVASSGHGSTATSNVPGLVDDVEGASSPMSSPMTSMTMMPPPPLFANAHQDMRARDDKADRDDDVDRLDGVHHLYHAQDMYPRQLPLHPALLSHPMSQSGPTPQAVWHMHLPMDVGSSTPVNGGLGSAMSFTPGQPFSHHALQASPLALMQPRARAGPSRDAASPARSKAWRGEPNASANAQTAATSVARSLGITITSPVSSMRGGSTDDADAAEETSRREPKGQGLGGEASVVARRHRGAGAGSSHTVPASGAHSPKAPLGSQQLLASSPIRGSPLRPGGPASHPAGGAAPRASSTHRKNPPSPAGWNLQRALAAAAAAHGQTKRGATGFSDSTTDPTDAPAQQETPMRSGRAMLSALAGTQQGSGGGLTPSPLHKWAASFAAHGRVATPTRDSTPQAWLDDPFDYGGQLQHELQFTSAAGRGATMSGAASDAYFGGGGGGGAAHAGHTGSSSASAAAASVAAARPAGHAGPLFSTSQSGTLLGGVVVGGGGNLLSPDEEAASPVKMLAWAHMPMARHHAVDTTYAAAAAAGGEPRTRATEVRRGEDDGDPTDAT